MKGFGRAEGRCPGRRFGLDGYNSIRLKFFTPEYYDSDDDDGTLFREVSRHYEEHLAFIIDRLPPDVRGIAGAFEVDDALVAKLRQWEPDGLQLVLRCGHLGIGYRDLDFRYSGVSIANEQLQNLVSVALSHRGSRRYCGRDCYCHEVDVREDGLFEHSLLFHSGCEWPDWRERVPLTTVSIACKSMTVSRIERPGRQLPPYPQRVRVERFGITVPKTAG